MTAHLCHPSLYRTSDETTSNWENVVDNGFEADRRQAMGLLEKMMLIRLAEERLSRVVREVGLPGALHLYIGQEAIAAGVCSNLDDRDWITSTHRGHGHFLAKGGDIKAMFAEIWGKRTGICKGMGGSMHVADFSRGIMGANGIVGGGLAIATGAAHAAKLDGDGRVAVCFFGDGASNQGVLMESLNLASIWQLPIIFVCENNGVAEFTVSATVTAGKLSDRARPFMPVLEIDGNDAIAVAHAAREAVERARTGGGPTFIEAHTYRIHGHLEAEDLFLGGGSYRTEDEIAAWRAEDRDPLQRLIGYATAASLIAAQEIEDLAADIKARVEDAVAFADASEEADPDLVFELLGERPN